MTFLNFGSAYAPAIADLRPAEQDIVVPAATDLVRLFVLDRLPSGVPLVCHWHRQPDGRLAAIWAPDIAPLPKR